MPQLHLTEIAVRSLKPREGQADYWDESTPSFGVRISKHGRKSWIVMLGPSRSRQKIGEWPDMPLAEARETAKKVLAQKSPNRWKIQSSTFEDAVDLFFTTHCADLRPRTVYETKRILNGRFLPKLKNKKLEFITKHDISSVLDTMLETPSESAHALKIAKTFFRWAIRRSYLQFNPCEGLRRPGRYVPRERVLSDAELKAVWDAADGTFGTIIRLLILTGQRRAEIGSLRGEYIDRSKLTITLPASITKNKRTHAFPYGDMTAAILEDLPLEGYLFPARGKEGPFNGWSKCKIALDKTVAKAGTAVAPWTVHDLRRTFATNLAALSVPPHITERLLNHVTGTISGVAAIYNRHAYTDEMRDAVTKWEARLASVLAAKTPAQ